MDFFLSKITQLSPSNTQKTYPSSPVCTVYVAYILQLLQDILSILLKQLTLFKKTCGWNVKGAGNSKATKHTNTQAEAYAYARTISINPKSELIVHGKNGQIRERNSYGNDPYPPKG